MFVFLYACMYFAESSEKKKNLRMRTIRFRVDITQSKDKLRFHIILSIIAKMSRQIIYRNHQRVETIDQIFTWLSNIMNECQQKVAKISRLIFEVGPSIYIFGPYFNRFKFINTLFSIISPYSPFITNFACCSFLNTRAYDFDSQSDSATQDSQDSRQQNQEQSMENKILRMSRSLNNKIDGQNAAKLQCWNFIQQVKYVSLFLNNQCFGYFSQQEYQYLTKFQLTHCCINNTTLKFISKAKWPNLKALRLEEAFYTADGVKYLQKLNFPKLASIFMSTEIGSQASRRITKIYASEELCLQNVQKINNSMLLVRPQLKFQSKIAVKQLVKSYLLRNYLHCESVQQVKEQLMGTPTLIIF